MAEKTDPNGYPTFSTRMDFTEPDILNLDLDLDLIFRPERVWIWIWILGIPYRNPTRNPNPIQTRNPKKNPNNINYKLYIIYNLLVHDIYKYL